MQTLYSPPGRISDLTVVTVNPTGAFSHRLRCSGSVHAWNTSSRGASKKRVMCNSGPVVAGAPRPVLSALADMSLPLLLDGLEVVIQRVEARVPEVAILLDPIRYFLERRRFDSRGAPLCVASARDQSGTLEHLEMPRDRRLADGERLRQLRDRRLSCGEARKNCAPGGVGEGRESGVESG